MSGSRYLISNGILSHTLDVPPVKLFLEAHPGAYTTSRTHNNASCLLFWERHMKRLSESLQILSNLAPQLLFKSNNAASLLPLLPNFPVWQPELQMLVDDSLGKVLPVALKERVDSVELAITTLVSGNLEELNACESETICEEKMSKIFNVHVHIETYVPPQFGIRGNGAHLAVGGYGRNVAAAKYSDWVRIRKTLEKLRPPSVTELLLSHDGNQILEGCVTNFFVVCRKDWDSDDGKVPYDYGNKHYFEVQTAPINDGVLPGIIRQLVLEVCRNEGIPFREVAPSWSQHEIWEEAFITSSLRLLQHVDSIQVPTEWQSAHSKTWKDISWAKKQFQGGPGMITTLIQEKVVEKAILEGYSISNICTRVGFSVRGSSRTTWRMNYLQRREPVENKNEFIFLYSNLEVENLVPLTSYWFKSSKIIKSMSGSRYLFSKGILSHTLDVPLAKVFLEAHPGAYTTSRTHENASCLMFWERHMKRLSESIQILSNLAPQLLFKSDNASTASLQPVSPNLPVWQPALKMLVNDSLEKILPVALKERVDTEELIITTLVSGNLEELNVCETISKEKMSKYFDVHVHIETYVPSQFGMRGNGEHLAVGGYGRNIAGAKYSDWVRIRKTLEKLRPPSVTEILLSYNGDQILEGSATNFFVVCRKDWDSNDGKSSSVYGDKNHFEVQTAPINDGVLPGIIRQLVLEVCKSEGIPFREVAPSWSKHVIWEEAFITNSLRILQHVESIQVPTEWESAHSKTWKDISWTKKQFKDGPGMITTLIQEKVMEKAISEGYPISNICTR